MDNTDVNTIENLCGGGGCSAPAPTPAPTPSNNAATTAPPVELHVCMGLNACKGHDRFGTNECAGMGFCATAERHNCHTLNNCRGQGGCGLYGDGEEQSNPGNNDCAWQGSCAVPIQAERYSTQGENKGKSVWVLARRLFEERMQKANRNVGDSPYKCGPPQAWLIQSLGSYDSCGNSGNKAGTFGFNDPAKDAAELCRNSQPHLCGAPDAANHCGSATDANHCGSTEQSPTDE
jgi:hypothetical protein